MAEKKYSVQTKCAKARTHTRLFLIPTFFTSQRGMGAVGRGREVQGGRGGAEKERRNQRERAMASGHPESDRESKRDSMSNLAGVEMQSPPGTPPWVLVT